MEVKRFGSSGLTAASHRCSGAQERENGREKAAAFGSGDVLFDICVCHDFYSICLRMVLSDTGYIGGIPGISYTRVGIAALQLQHSIAALA